MRNKYLKHYKLAISFFILVLMVLLILGLVLGKYTNKLNIKSLDTNQVVNLYLKTRVYTIIDNDKNVTFYGKMSISDIEQELKEKNDIRIGTTCNNFDILYYESENNKYIYGIKKNSNNTYMLGNMGTEIVYDITSDKTKGFHFVLPYYLISDDRLQLGSKTKAYIKEAYKTDYSIDDFYQFYNRLGIYQIEEQNDRLIIKDYLSKTEKNSELPCSLEIVFLKGNFFLSI